MKATSLCVFLALVLVTGACASVPPAPATDIPASLPAATNAPATATPTRGIPVVALTAALTPAPPTITPTATRGLPQPSPSVTPAVIQPTPPPPPVSPAPSATKAASQPTVLPSQTAPPKRAATAVATPSEPIDIVVDDRDTGFATSGSWFEGDGGQSYDGGCKWAPRGIGNIAYFDPKLPVRGAYEVFAWWCGDPNHDQTNAARIYIYPTIGRIVPYQIDVDLQQNAGKWVSLGTYFMETVGTVSLSGNLYGNVVADAFRFVYRSPDAITITPTPGPTRQVWTNHPPSPLEQITAGDLTARLGLVQWLYQYSPVVWSREIEYDDCAGFPRPGCSGVRKAWDVVVQYKGQNIAYRASADFKHAVLLKPAELPGHQTLYVMVTKGNWFMRIDRYPDDTWWYSISTYDPGGAGSSGPLNEGTAGEIVRWSGKYNSVRTQIDGGFSVSFYGQGSMVEFEQLDALAVTRMVEELTAHALPAP